MEFDNLLKLIRTVSESALTELKYEGDGVKLSLRADRSGGVTVIESAGFQQVAAPDTQDAIPVTEPSGMVLTSPLVGIFYTAPSEDAADFVKIGDTVRKGQTLAIIEAMKLMNEIESEADGTVTAILATNGMPVEYGQPLFRIG